MEAIILCGGTGSRLKPLTDQMNKQVIPIANTPIVVRTVDSMIEAGIRDIKLIVQKGASEEIIQLLGDGAKWDATFTYIEQEKPMGTGHAVQQALPYLDKESDVLVWYGDNVIGDNLSELMTVFQTQPKTDAMVITHPVNNPQDYGIVEQQEGQVKGLEEKPAEPRSKDALTGVFFFRSKMMSFFNDIEKSTRGEYELTSVLQKIIASPTLMMKSQQLRSWWRDIGNPDKLLEANQLAINDLVNGQPQTKGVIIGKNTMLVRCKTVPPVVIGDEVIAIDSTIGPNAVIGDGNYLTNMVVRNSTVGKNSTLVGFRLTQGIVGKKVERRVNVGAGLQTKRSEGGVEIITTNRKQYAQRLTKKLRLLSRRHGELFKPGSFMPLSKQTQAER